MKRNKPLRANPDKVRAWRQRSAKGLKRKKPVKQRSEKRAVQDAYYSVARKGFLREHPICPVTGEEATQIHHSAKREGRWLNLQRYWVAVSAEGHEAIENNKKWAASHGLMVRISASAEEWIAYLQREGLSLYDPVFYENWDGKIIGLP